MSQSGFFDLDERYESLSKCGDPLEVLAREIPFRKPGWQLLPRQYHFGLY